MSNEKILTTLKKKLQGYRDHQEVLQHRVIQAQEQLNSVNKLVVETEEAIAALEGRTSEIRRTLEDVLKQQSQPMSPAMITPGKLLPAVPNPTSNPGQLPAEPGFRWDNGNLVPISIPDGLIALDDEVDAPVPLPPVDDEFDEIDPMDFNPKY